MSSPHYPQSNGHAEATVKAMKNLLKKSSQSGQLNSDLYLRGLLKWRNTPGADGQSPAQILFGRQLHSRIPAHDSGNPVTLAGNLEVTVKNSISKYIYLAVSSQLGLISVAIKHLVALKEYFLNEEDDLMALHSEIHPFILQL